MARRAVLGVVRRVLRGEEPKIGVRRDGELAAGASRLARDATRAKPKVAAAEHIFDHTEHSVLGEVRLVQQKPQPVLDSLGERAKAKGEGVVVAAQPELTHKVGDGRIWRHVKARHWRVGAMCAEGNRRRLAASRLPLQEYRLSVLCAVEQPRRQLRHRVGHDEAWVGGHAAGEVRPAREVLNAIAAVAEELLSTVWPAILVGCPIPSKAQKSLGVDARVAPSLKLRPQYSHRHVMTKREVLCHRRAK